MRFTTTVCLLYSALASYRDFAVNEGEYTVMVMAPYGSPRYTDRVCFFFQAEDGIRDLTVTGVQTCALPISEQLFGWRATEVLGRKIFALAAPSGDVETLRDLIAHTAAGVVWEGEVALCDRNGKIGRASCRERV